MIQKPTAQRLTRMFTSQCVAFGALPKASLTELNVQAAHATPPHQMSAETRVNPEEIFGLRLPVLAYDRLAEVGDHSNGGVGNPGIDNHLGEEDFRELSQTRTVFQRCT